MYKNIAMVCLTGALFVACTGNRSAKTDEKRASQTEEPAVKAGNDNTFLLAGTYTSVEGSKGIYVYRFDTETGKADSVTMAEVANPSYLTLSPDEQFVYSVSENGEGDGAVHAFSFDKNSGRLALLNSQPTRGSGPCYITIDSKGKSVHTANYGDGSISSFHVNRNGNLSSATSVMLFKGSGPDSVRQTKPHLHSVMYSPDGRFLFAADLGTDKLYRFTAIDTPFEGQPAIYDNSLKEFNVPEGTGPRHFDFSDGGKCLYVLGELSGEIIVYDYNYGELVQKQVITADTVGARGSADIHLSPDGRFLYASTRLQADGIAVFSVHPEDGTLTKVGYQPTAKHPRNFAITPNGTFLLVAGRDDNKIQVFAIDTKTGLLTDTHQDIPIDKPVCLKFTGMN
jgi:3-carboxymuconate cyclase